jgi:hypothetical protein
MSDDLLNDAQTTLDALRRAHADALARQTIIAHDRGEIAFLAHTGDKKARAKLDALNQEGAILAGEISSLAAAVGEAEDRLTRAEAEVAAAQARARAANIRDTLLPQFVEAGQRCAEGLDQFTSNLATVLGLAGEIGRLGGSMSKETVRVVIQRSIQARLFLAGRMNSEPILKAPSSIITIEQAIEQFAATAASRAASVISGEAVPIAAVAPPHRAGEPTADYPEIPGWDAVLRAEAAESHPVEEEEAA